MSEYRIIESCSGYDILEDVKGNKALGLKEDHFTTIVHKKDKYRILKRKADGISFLQAKEWFCLITDVTESSKGIPVLKVVTLPDQFMGMLIDEELIINPNKTIDLKIP